MQIDRYNRHSFSDIVVSATVFIVIAVFIIFVVGTVVNEMYRIDEGMIVNRYIVWDTVNKIPRSSYVFVIEGEKGEGIRYLQNRGLVQTMIKIIKPGKIPDTTKRFECSRCGCIFEADKGDYADRENQEEGNADTN